MDNTNEASQKTPKMFRRSLERQGLDEDTARPLGIQTVKNKPNINTDQRDQTAEEKQKTSLEIKRFRFSDSQNERTEFIKRRLSHAPDISSTRRSLYDAPLCPFTDKKKSSDEDDDSEGELKEKKLSFTEALRPDLTVEQLEEKKTEILKKQKSKVNWRTIIKNYFIKSAKTWPPKIIKWGIFWTSGYYKDWGDIAQENSEYFKRLDDDISDDELTKIENEAYRRARYAISRGLKNEIDGWESYDSDDGNGKFVKKLRRSSLEKRHLDLYTSHEARQKVFAKRKEQKKLVMRHPELYVRPRYSPFIGWLDGHLGMSGDMQEEDVEVVEEIVYERVKKEVGMRGRKSMALRKSMAEGLLGKQGVPLYLPPTLANLPPEEPEEMEAPINPKRKSQLQRRKGRDPKKIAPEEKS